MLRHGFKGYGQSANWLNPGSLTALVVWLINRPFENLNRAGLLVFRKGENKRLEFLVLRLELLV